MKPKKIKIIFAFFIALQAIFFTFFPALTLAATTTPTYQGPEASIQKYLCTPTIVAPQPILSVNSGQSISGTSNGGQTNAAAGDLYACVNRMYRFAIAAAVAVSVFMIVIAGYLYMSADGNGESVDKAKSILTSSIAALVILFAGYILLNALNPDLIQFHNVQPPSVTPQSSTTPSGIVTPPSTGGTGGGKGGCNGTTIDGYDLSSYASAQNHTQVVCQVYTNLLTKDFSSAGSITQYMQTIAPSTPLTGDMVNNAAVQYGVDARMVVALMQVDSSLGTQGVGARTHNPGNVGNTDNGATKDWGSWQAGVNAVASWLSTHRSS